MMQWTISLCTEVITLSNICEMEKKSAKLEIFSDTDNT